MKYSYFPGCSMSATGREYDKSLKYVNQEIGLELIEIPDWNCCGATAGHSTSKELGVALPARNVALCEKQGLHLPIAVPCAACYSAMKHAVHEARQGKAQADKLSQLIGMPITGELDVVSILEAYATPTAKQNIQLAMKKTFNGMKIACYYGCLFMRPTAYTGVADPENPTIMEDILAPTGAELVNWAFKSECCGGSHNVDLPKVAKKAIYKILKNARANGAEAIVTACPLCMLNLDMRENEVNKDENENFDIPVYYFTEILALAMGATPKQAGITTHFHPAEKLIAEKLSERGAI